MRHQVASSFAAEPKNFRLPVRLPEGNGNRNDVC
jgi:hypothetical protein